MHSQGPKGTVIRLAQKHSSYSNMEEGQVGGLHYPEQLVQSLVPRPPWVPSSQGTCPPELLKNSLGEFPVQFSST